MGFRKTLRIKHKNTEINTMKIKLDVIVATMDFDKFPQEILTTLDTSPFTMPDDATEDWYLGVLYIIMQFENLTNDVTIKAICNSFALVTMYNAWKKFYNSEIQDTDIISDDLFSLPERKKRN